MLTSVLLGRVPVVRVGRLVFVLSGSLYVSQIEVLLRPRRHSVRTYTGNRMGGRGRIREKRTIKTDGILHPLAGGDMKKFSEKSKNEGGFPNESVKWILQGDYSWFR